MYIRPILPADPTDLPAALQREFDRLAIELRGIRDGRVYYAKSGTAAPTSGSNAQGDIVRNSAPTEVTNSVAPPYVVLGWICTEEGSPGTWEEVRAQTATTLDTTYGWEDSLADISAGRAIGANAPTWSTFRNGISAYAFSASTMKEVWVNSHITHNYRAGSKVYPHVHWSTTGTDTGTVRWGIEYTAQKGHNQGAFPATSTIYLEQAASGTAYQHMITEASSTDAFNTNLEVDSLILMRVFRDATNDTCTDTAFAFFVDLHYQVDRAYGTLNKAPNFYA